MAVRKEPTPAQDSMTSLRVRKWQEEVSEMDMNCMDCERGKGSKRVSETLPRRGFW